MALLMPVGSLYLKWKYKFTPEKRQEEMSLNLQKDGTNIFIPACRPHPVNLELLTIRWNKGDCENIKQIQLNHDFSLMWKIIKRILPLSSTSPLI